MLLSAKEPTVMLMSHDCILDVYPLGTVAQVADADISSTAGKTGIGNMHGSDTSHTSEQSSTVQAFT